MNKITYLEFHSFVFNLLSERFNELEPVEVCELTTIIFDFYKDVLSEEKEGTNYIFKPSWSDATDWANWLALTDDGEWYWFENKPKKTNFGWCVRSPKKNISSRYEEYEENCYQKEINKMLLNWKQTLEQRPK